MKMVFADICYFIALLNPNDRLHNMAIEVSRNLGYVRIITSEMVLVEMLNALSKHGETMRKLVTDTVKSLEKNPNNIIVPQTSLQFQSTINRYASRLDKDWGATDCASFILMEEKGISEALTSDHHFTQAGFTILLKELKS